MTEKQIKEYEKLSELKEQYENFIARDGDVSITYYSNIFHESMYARVTDNEFKDSVKTLAKERLEIITKQIEEL